MIKIINRYFLSHFIKTFFFSMMTFLVFFLIIDFVEKIDRLVAAESIYIVLDFYLNFMPFMIVMVTPIAMLMASLFTMGQFVSSGEITAVKAGGISLTRLFIPVYIFALLVSGFIFWFGENILPEAEIRKDEIWTVDIKKSNTQVNLINTNIFFQETNNRFVNINRYNGIRKFGNDINILQHDDNTLTANIFADSIMFQGDVWVLKNAVIREFTNGVEKLTRTKSYIIDDFIFTEEDLLKKENDPEKMNIYDLKRYIDKQKIMGISNAKFKVDFHHKIAFPLVSFIMVLLGLPMAAKKRKGGLAIGFATGLMICFFYYVFMVFVEAFGYKGALDPILAAWMSNIVFGGVGVYSLFTARK